MSYEVDIVIPKFSDEIDDVQIVNWLKSVGEAIEFGEPILELEVNKSNIELDSPAAGVLGAVFCWEGEEVIAGERIGAIEVEDDEVTAGDVLAVETIDPDDLEEDKDEEEELHDNLDNYDEENIL